ncbi:hypothetical protein PRZ48_007905 [Zasmidium cellare]|uniref:Uncharacterized protein n=1 Tax=Zasmidium cellare TaxID=395010 RepID=A0ABR0EL32_ZASCE|nr:hypothetical protein PRZ48_007905 [Zasmidium cellare]
MKTTLAFLVGSLVVSVVTLIVTIAINATVANEPDNDYGKNTGWAVLMPAPAASFVWTIVDLAVYVIWEYHVIHWLVTSVFLTALNVAIGIVGVMLYDWHESAWVAGMFILFAAVL